MILGIVLVLAGGISDNSFLLEEAYNQTPGVVQHIGTATIAGDPDDAKHRTLELGFTQEWPLFSERHQISYSIPYSREYRRDGTAEYRPHEGGLGDVELNYRYALAFEDPEMPAIAPRLTVITPTSGGDAGWGFEGAIPASKSLGPLAVHANVAFGWTPHVSATLPTGIKSRPVDLFSILAGGSVVLTASDRVQPLVEVVYVRDDEIGPLGLARPTHVTVVSPGVRWGADISGGQLVLGLAAPIGLTEDAPPLSGLLYVSFEHAFTRD